MVLLGVMITINVLLEVLKMNDLFEFLTMIDLFEYLIYTEEVWVQLQIFLKRHNITDKGIS